MAVVAFTTYSAAEDCKRTNEYISDGHGLPPVVRTNRYLSDGHGGWTKCIGYKCPGDPILATAYMEAKRWNYERQHSYNPARKKGRVTHIQLYVSPTEEDQVPTAERLDMTRELIERTVLRDFPSIYIAHDNTKQGHCHISLCPFSEDGTHKLCMNNALLYELRRQMDYICVEHGYSIIESPELWGDRAYRDWFQEVKARGVVTVHPQREQDKSFQKREKQRARDYAQRKRAQAKHQEEMEHWYQEISRYYVPELEDYYYTSSWLYNPTDPGQPLRISRITNDGRIRSDLEMQAAAMGAWAYLCKAKLEEKSIPGTVNLQKRLYSIMSRAYASRQLVADLDIRSLEELVMHQKECGQDIGNLRRSIKSLDAELEKGRPLIQAIEKWEGERDAQAWQYLKGAGVDSGAKRKEKLDQAARLLARKESQQVMLEERSKEYRNLKEVEKALNPACCKDAWDEYLSMLFPKAVVQTARCCTREDVEDAIFELGMILGIPNEVMDEYICKVENDPVMVQNLEYRSYIKHMCSANETQRRAYEKYFIQLASLKPLWDLSRKLESFGILGFLLSIVVGLVAELHMSSAKVDLSKALWDARLERWHANTHRWRADAAKAYHQEVLDKMEKDRQEAVERMRKLLCEMTGVDFLNRKEEVQVLPICQKREQRYFSEIL